MREGRSAEAVLVEYETLPAVTDLTTAMEEDQPQVWPEHVKGNEAFHWHIGDKAAVDREFASAASTHKLTIVNNRVVANPMEPRSVTASWDTATSRLTVHGSTLGSHFWKREIGKLLGLGKEDVRVVTGDVGAGGDKVLQPDQGITDGAGWNRAGPLCRKGHPAAAFEGRKLVAPPGAGGTVAVLLHLLHLVGGCLLPAARVVPRAMITRRHHQCGVA